MFFGSVGQAVRLYSVCEAAKARFTWIRWFTDRIRMGEIHEQQKRVLVVFVFWGWCLENTSARKNKKNLRFLLFFSHLFGSLRLASRKYFRSEEQKKIYVFFCSSLTYSYFCKHEAISRNKYHSEKNRDSHHWLHKRLWLRFLLYRNRETSKTLGYCQA